MDHDAARLKDGGVGVEPPPPLSPPHTVDARDTSAFFE